MIRYELDKLGWYQFEWLVQTLLKNALGLGIETWGGSGDFGRDSFFSGTLRFPTNSDLTGAFLFQSKFIEGANAAGAKHHGALISSVRKEVARFSKRRLSGSWEEPVCFALYTNAVLATAEREQISQIVKAQLNTAVIVSFGGNDICDLIDLHPQVRRAFPPLLSLRDLDQLLAEVVNHDIIVKSNSAILQARDILDVFVPTSAYDRSWQILHKHNFLVLEGPPEVGKTAIGWMLALAQLSQGWEAAACDSPDDFFRQHSPDRSQIFVADDAFGRTEYDPARCNKWENQLDRILRQLDKNHWLVWTSRKHILERSLKAMDLQGTAGRFPNPGAVLVDASKLSLEEKALILYKHAKRAQLPDSDKALLKSHARRIVNNPNFTPERIRRLVVDTLPKICAEKSLADEVLSAQITEAINNPTAGMRKSFQQLSQSHKWILISLLEGGHVPTQGKLEPLYASHCPREHLQPFGEVFDELLESFITVSDGVIRWTHPSCRDLVIDELSRDPALNRRFLESISLEGIKIGISISGGSSGERNFPLMTSQESWSLLENRCQSVVANESVSATIDLIEILRRVIDDAPEEPKEHLSKILRQVCDAASLAWTQREEVLRAEQIESYGEATLLLSPMPPIPNLEPSWRNGHDRFMDAIDHWDIDLSPDVIEEWTRLVVALTAWEPRLLKKVRFVESTDGWLTSLRAKLRHELDSPGVIELDSRRTGFATLAEQLEVMSGFNGVHNNSELEQLARDLEEESAECERLANEGERDEPPVSAHATEEKEFDIDALFSDL